MHEINQVDPSLKNYYNETIISIQISLDGFSLAIHSEGDKQIRAFRHYQFKNLVMQEDLLNATSDILHKDELLRLPHKQARVMYTNRKSTLLPAPLIAKENLKQVLGFNHTIDDLDEIHINALTNCNAGLVFTIPTYLAGILAEKLKIISFYNQATPLITTSIESSAGNDQSEIVIQCTPEFFDLMIIKQGNLALYNTFPYSSSNDLLYYTLFACKQLSVDIKTASAYMYGQTPTIPKLVEEIKEYIQATNLGKKNNAASKNIALPKVDANRFYSLLNLIHCE